MIDDDTIMRSNLSKLVRLTRRRDLLTSDESKREKTGTQGTQQGRQQGKQGTKEGSQGTGTVPRLTNLFLPMAPATAVSVDSKERRDYAA